MRKLNTLQSEPYRLTALQRWHRCVAVFLCVLMLTPFDLFSAVMQDCGEIGGAESATADYVPVHQNPDNTEEKPLSPDSAVYLDEEVMVRTPLEYEYDEASDTIQTVVVDEKSPYGLDGKKIFNPSPTRAVWMSALFPGLGQIYNRRYWKLPIIVGGFMGLGYATSWNNRMLTDYTQAYRDLMDSDPETQSYMNFFPPTTKEEDLDKAWLTNTMRSRRDFYRRNRDLCIIFCVGLYLLCMVDAYVDASLAHFDISPDLSVEWSPALIVNPTSKNVSAGLNWAFNF